jgi:hypothetical protein
MVPGRAAFLLVGALHVKNDASMRQVRGLAGCLGISVGPYQSRHGCPTTRDDRPERVDASMGDHAPVRLTIGIAAFRAIAAAVTKAEIGGAVPSVTISQLRPDLERMEVPWASS